MRHTHPQKKNHLELASELIDYIRANPQQFEVVVSGRGGVIMEVHANEDGRRALQECGVDAHREMRLSREHPYQVKLNPFYGPGSEDSLRGKLLNNPNFNRAFEPLRALELNPDSAHRGAYPTIHPAAYQPGNYVR